MAFDPARFRIDFPEFADATRFTASLLTLWAGIASKMIDKDRWGEAYSLGLSLYVAHSLSLAGANPGAAQGSGPGQGGGIVSDKRVGSISVSYDTASVVEPGAGHWNQTTYGRQYIRMARMIGAGCVQI